MTCIPLLGVDIIRHQSEVWAWVNNVGHCLFLKNTYIHLMWLTGVKSDQIGRQDASHSGGCTGQARCDSAGAGSLSAAALWHRLVAGTFTKLITRGSALTASTLKSVVRSCEVVSKHNLCDWNMSTVDNNILQSRSTKAQLMSAEYLHWCPGNINKLGWQTLQLPALRFGGRFG